MGLLVARLTLRPTALALPWSTVLAVSVSGLLIAALSGALSDRQTLLPVIIAGAAAAAAVAALRDPADELLRPLPTSVLSRRLVRIVLVSIVVAPTTLGVAILTPGPGAAAATLALGSTGVAAATWLPSRRLLAAAAVPPAWVIAGLALEDRLGPLGDAATWWSTAPWLVAALAVLTIVAGRNR